MFYAFETRHPLLAEYLLTEVDIYPYPTIKPENHKTIRAKWDTGANHSVISIRLKEQLNLIPIASETISGVGGPQLIEVVRLAVKLPNDLFIASKRIGVCNIQSAHNIDMLIGMDIGLVRQPGWLSNKSCEKPCFSLFFSGSCSETEVSEQLYYTTW